VDASSGFKKGCKYYLRDEVYFEPLFNHWYAWPYLLPPVTAARHMTNTHRRIMKSFVNDYELHILAANQNGMAGGEFLDCDETKVPKIENLIEEIEETHHELVSLSKAVEELDELLRNHTSGESIEPLYADIPESLKGYVELFLDLEHRPSYRLLEALLYKSSYYKKSLQSVSFGLLDRVAERPFVLSTPRLPDENHVQFNVDFNHPMLDSFFRSRIQPLEKSELDALFKGVELSGGLSPRELFVETSSEYKHKPLDGRLRITYTGHAGFLIETDRVSLLIDPVIANKVGEYKEQVVSFTELPEHIDYICLTHNHQDHVNIESLLQLRYRTGKVVVPKNNGGTLADPSMKQLLKQLNFEVVEVDDLDRIEMPGGAIVAIPFLGEHGDLNIRSKAAWFVELADKRLFFGADSANPEPVIYERLGDILHGVDLFAIGMECIGAPYTWLYGALHTKVVGRTIKNSRRLNGSDFRQAMPMVKNFKAKKVLIYALGLEPWYKYFMGIDYADDSVQLAESKKVINACSELGIEAEIMYGKRAFEYS
jgi:L-ascorbate metabolism protein UlaG (beta-lactamase superfamily)